MEKPSARNTQLYKRLLKTLGVVVCMFFPLPFFAQTAVIRHADAFCQSGDIAVFQIVVFETHPSKTEFEIPALPEEIKFVSSRKTLVRSSEADNTEIELIFKFLAAGVMQLPPLSIEADGKRLSVEFEPVRVMLPPEQMKASVWWQIEGDGQDFLSGQSFVLTLHAKYVQSIQQFSNKIPENSLFTQATELVTDPDPDKTGEEKAIVSFKWTPLVKGDYFLPVAQLVLVEQSGKTVTLFTPEQKITVAQGRSWSRPAEKEPAGLNSAFAQTAGTPQTVSVNLTNKTLAQEAANKKKHLQSFFVYSMLVSLVGAVFLAFMLRKKKRFLPAFVAALVLFFVLFFMLQTEKKSSYFAGGVLYLIPELSGSQVTSLPAGTKLTVLDRAGKWVYVSFNSKTNGWVLAEDLF